MLLRSSYATKERERTHDAESVPSRAGRIRLSFTRCSCKQGTLEATMKTHLARQSLRVSCHRSPALSEATSPTSCRSGRARSAHKLWCGRARPALLQQGRSDLAPQRRRSALLGRCSGTARATLRRGSEPTQERAGAGRIYSRICCKHPSTIGASLRAAASLAEACPQQRLYEGLENLPCCDMCHARPRARPARDETESDGANVDPVHDYVLMRSAVCRSAPCSRSYLFCPRCEVCAQVMGRCNGL